MEALSAPVSGLAPGSISPAATEQSVASSTSITASSQHLLFNQQFNEATIFNFKPPNSIVDANYSYSSSKFTRSSKAAAATTISNSQNASSDSDSTSESKTKPKRQYIRIDDSKKRKTNEKADIELEAVWSRIEALEADNTILRETIQELQRNESLKCIIY